jgi:short-subunit dehydrogenase
MRNLKNKYGPWALITGASSGIGEEFAYQLAAMGFNLVLLARHESRLEQVSHHIKQLHNIQTLPIAIDLSQPDFLQALSEKTAALEIGFLVSNAAGYRYGSFHKSDLTETAAFLRLNTNAPMQLAHFYGNKMKARGRGGILLVSSTGAFSAIPYMASYVASKAFVLSLGESLHIELKEHGVDVMVLAPGTTETPGTMNAENIDNNKLGVKFMSPKIVVQQTLNVFGKKVMFIPGGMNKFSFFLGKRILSRLAMARFLGGIMKKAISQEVI